MAAFNGEWHTCLEAVHGNTWDSLFSEQSKAVDRVFALLGLPRVDGPLTEQITLPHRHGGLGLSHASPTDGVAAYLAAAATAHRAMHRGPEAFRPFHGPSGDVLRPQWEALHDSAQDLWSPDAREAGPDSLGTIAAAQSAISRRSAQFRANALMDSYDPRTDGGKRARARLLSCACRPASAWLVTLPLSRALELKSGEVQTVLRHRLGLTMLPPNAPAVQCCCGAALRHTDFDHAMRCSALAPQLTLRHDILKGILRRAVHRGGIASTLELALRRLPGLAAGAGTSTDGSPIRVKARGDVLLAMPQGIAIAEVSITPPTSFNTLSRAAATAGAAASHRDRQKQTAYARVEPNGYSFVPFSVESYGRLGQPAMALLHSLGDEAAGPGGVSRASFVAGALRELSKGLIRGNFLLYRASVGMLARSSGSSFRAGLSVPTDEHVVQYALFSLPFLLVSPAHGLTCCD
jgi:hypothetical protein